MTQQTAQMALLPQPCFLLPLLHLRPELSVSCGTMILAHLLVLANLLLVDGSHLGQYLYVTVCICIREHFFSGPIH